MKKSLLALGVLSAFAGVAHAQSSVTLYGLIDEGLDYTTNVGGKHVYEMVSGMAQGSRWGLKGTEDLGGGLSAIFQLENGFDVNTGKLGQGGRMFGRQAFVGLSSTTAGALTLGRQYDSVVDYLAPVTANGSWAGELFSHPLDNDNTDNSFRFDNAIKYTSVNYAGLQFGGAYAFSNTAGQFSNNRGYSVGASYTNGPLLLGAAYMDVKQIGNGTAGAVTSDDASFIAGNARIFGAGINYTIAAATLGFAYSNANYTDPTGNGYTGIAIGGTNTGLKFNNFEINAKYQFTPAFYVGGMYTYTQAKFTGPGGQGRDKYNQFGLMADYNLSKRTDVYVQGTYMKVTGRIGNPGLDNAFIIGTQGPASGQKQFVGRVGIRHQF